MKKFILIFCICLASTTANANQATLNGFVYDASNGEGLIGANVIIKGTSMGASTNLSGYYVVPKLPVGQYTVMCDYIGYQTVEEQVTIKADVDLTLDFNLQVKVLEGEITIVRADSVRVAEQLFNKEISKIELNRRQINSIPQVAEADLLRSLQTLPGILPVSDFSTALYIRGGTPDQNLYLLDGTDVYNPEHAFGLFSTFNTDAIKQVELSKGGFAANYGGRLSSVLDVTNLDGNREEFEGTAAISLLSAKTTLQMPISDFGSLSGSIRRTYFDQTIATMLEDIPDYYFYDGNIKAFFDINDRNNLTVSGYGGRDYLNLNFIGPADTDDAGFKYDWGNRTGSIRWTHIFTPRLFSNFWVTGSRFSSNFEFFGTSFEVTERNFVSDITLKGNLEYHHSQKVVTKFGFEQKNLHVIWKQKFPGGNVDVDNRSAEYLTYLTASWRPSVLWDIEAGLRYTYFDGPKNYHNLTPRLGVKYRLTDTISLKASSGMYTQYLHRLPRTFVSDIWAVSDKYQEDSEAFHYILGVQKEVANDYQLEIESYYKTYKDIHSFNEAFITEVSADYFDENDDPVYTEARGLFNKGKGYSTGLEFLLRKDVGFLTGWTGLSVSKTMYEITKVNQGKEFAPRHDRRVAFNLVSNLDVKNLKRAIKGRPLKAHKSTWILGINFVYTTGQPITPPGSAYIIGSNPDQPFGFVEIYPSEINGVRLPSYARLDISVTYEKKYKNWSYAPYIQVFNVGNRKNVWYISYDYEYGESKVETQGMFPVLPTIGVNFTF